MVNFGLLFGIWTNEGKPASKMAKNHPYEFKIRQGEPQKSDFQLKSSQSYNTSIMNSYLGFESSFMRSRGQKKPFTKNCIKNRREKYDQSVFLKEFCSEQKYNKDDRFGEAIKKKIDKLYFVQQFLLTFIDGRDCQVAIGKMTNKKGCVSYSYGNERQFINLIVAVLLLNIIKEVRAVCCLSFSGLECIKCPKDMHLFNGNCLNNKPNCLIYEDGFQCSYCVQDYILDKITKKCVPKEFEPIYKNPNYGFVQISTSDYESPLIGRLTDATKKYFQPSLSAKIDIIARIYVRRQNATEQKVTPTINETRYYRFIFYTDRGLFQATTVYYPLIAPLPNTTLKSQNTNTSVQRYQGKKNVSFSIGPNEEFIVWETQGNRKKIQKILETRFPEISSFQILEVFRSLQQVSPNATKSTSSGSEPLPTFIYAYRLIMVNPNEGLFEISITISDPLTEIINTVSLDPTLTAVLSRFSMTVYPKLLSGSILTNLTLTQGIYNVTYSDPGQGIVAPKSYITFYINKKNNNVIVGNRFFYKDSSFNSQPPSNTQAPTRTPTASTMITPVTPVTPISPGIPVKPVVNPPLPVTPPITPVTNPNPVQVVNTSVPKTNTTLPTAPLVVTPSPLPANNAASSGLIEPFFVKNLNNLSDFTTPMVLGFVSNGLPTFRQLGPDLIYQEYVNTTKFLNTNMYSGIHSLFSAYYPTQAINGDMVRAALAENSTIYVLQVSYRPYEADRHFQYYQFALDRRSQLLELIRDYRVSENGRVDYQINEQNRASFIANAEPKLKAILTNQLPKDPLYSPESKLFSAQTREFNSRFTQASNLTKYYNIYTLKYFYPDATNRPYQYVQFRYQIADNRSQTFKSLGKAIFGKQIFVFYKNTTDSADVIELLGIMEQFLKVPQANFTNFTTYYSTERENTYRVVFNLNNLFQLTYEVQKAKINTQPFLISNVSIEQKKPEPPPQVIKSPVEQKIIQFNIFIFLSVFPNRYYQRAWVPLPVAVSVVETSDQLTIDNATQIVVNFFNIYTVSNVKIINRRSLYSILDSYTVQYTQNVPYRGNYVLSSPRRFSFEVPRRRKRYFGRGFQPFLQSTGISSSSSVSPNANAAPIPNSANPVNVSKVLAQKKPLRILETLLNRNIKVEGTNLTSSNLPQSTSSGSRLSSSQPFIGASPTSGSVNPSAAVDNFVQNLPEVVPISYTTESTQKIITNSSLKDPEKIDPSVIDLLSNNIMSPNAYDAQLTKIQSQRTFKDDPKSIVISLEHAYFGDIKVVGSVGNNQVSEMDYVNSGYLIVTNDTGIVVQVEEIYNASKMVSDEIGSAIAKLNYTENNKTKVVTEKDIIFWKFKKIDSVMQYEFIYEFFGFIIKSGAIVQKNETNSSKNNMTITHMEAVGNTIKRLTKERDRKASIEVIKARPEYGLAQAFLKKNYGFYLSSYDLSDLKMQIARSDISFTLNLMGNSTGFLLKVTLNTQTNITRLSQLSRLPQSQVLSEGCAKQVSGKKQCSECWKEYSFYKKDKFCYKKLSNCEVQSGELCLACEKSFILNNNYQCI